MSDTNNMRRDFEESAKTHDLDLAPDEYYDGFYKSVETDYAWIFWQAATERAAASQWQPIATAPKGGGHLILAVAGRSFLGVWVDIPYQEYRNEDGVYLDHQDASAFWMDIADGEEVEPTHWQPLPPPPAIRQGGDT